MIDFEDKTSAIARIQRATEYSMTKIIYYLKNTAVPNSEEARAIIATALAERDCDLPDGCVVASGVQSHEPHEIGSGDIAHGVPIVIDIYPRCKKTGYWADMTRTICLGEASDELQKMYTVTKEALDLVHESLKPGARGEQLYNMVQDFFQKQGFKTSGKGKEFKYKNGFVHALGHGIGKKIHEKPFLKRGDDLLKEGDIIAIEPGLYYEHIGGVRIEDLFLITKDGSKKITNFGYRLIA